MRMGLSISIATGLYGISFGALSVGAGLNLWQTMALSALMFTGGSQFAGRAQCRLWHADEPHAAATWLAQGCGGAADD